MFYDPVSIVAAYEQNAQVEDASEKGLSLRVQLPREFIKKYLDSIVVYDQLLKYGIY